MVEATTAPRVPRSSLRCQFLDGHVTIASLHGERISDGYVPRSFSHWETAYRSYRRIERRLGDFGWRTIEQCSIRTVSSGRKWRKAIGRMCITSILRVMGNPVSSRVFSFRATARNRRYARKLYHTMPLGTFLSG